jgi:hypothetical protein
MIADRTLLKEIEELEAFFTDHRIPAQQHARSELCDNQGTALAHCHFLVRDIRTKTQGEAVEALAFVRGVLFARGVRKLTDLQPFVSAEAA